MTSGKYIYVRYTNFFLIGAGLGTFLTYATFMKRNQGAVKLGSATPIMNNVVSLMCGILIFSTVFSVQRELGQTKSQIVNTLQYNGPGNTGLTFIWCVDSLINSSCCFFEIAILFLLAGCLCCFRALVEEECWRLASFSVSHWLD
jgi:SNF family Na+-dependent transporter